MKIFSIFKKRKTEPNELTPVGILRLTQEYVPDFYKDNLHFQESKEFLKYNECGLALENLIEMAEESRHYFSEDFWFDLATCADKMQMTDQANFCRQQIIRNELEVGTKTPRGWTTIKIDNNSFEHHVAKIIENKWLNEIHTKDKLDELVKTNGFHLKSHGRFGIIYYIENGKVLEIGFEISGVRKYDLLLDFDNLSCWTIPNNTKFAFKEKSIIREALLQWLKTKRLKTDLE